MRKRTIISLILVLVILGLSHNAWLTIRSKQQSTVTSIRGGGGSSSTEINRLLTLRTRVSIKFDAMIFIIIAILGFMLSYKLTSYLADFKVEKKYSRLDILFLAACAVLIFLPMSHISDAKKSKLENRNLATWRPLINKNGNINYNFGRDYDRWFSDRFNLRYYLLNLYYYCMLSENAQPKIVVGKDGWYFFRDENGIKNFLNLDLFSRKELQYIANYLQTVNDYCKTKNKHFYLFIAPDKNKIYGEYYPDYIIRNIPDTDSRARQLINYLKEHTDVKIIYPYEELMNAKKDGIIYWKNDTHWNYMGAYIGYKALMKAINDDGIRVEPVIPKLEFSRAQESDLGAMLVGRLKRTDKEVEYPYPYIPQDYELTISGTTPDDIFSHNDMFTVNEKKAPRVVMFRDSFTRGMMPFLANTFSHVSYYWRYDVSKKLIEDADIVIIESVERRLYIFKNNKFTN